MPLDGGRDADLVAHRQFGQAHRQAAIGHVVETRNGALDGQRADETEEAAVCLGASRLKTFFYVILPMLYPALVTGFALAFARALGEYGSVVFVSGNMPYRTEIAPVLIVEVTVGGVTAAFVDVAEPVWFSGVMPFGSDEPTVTT